MEAIADGTEATPYDIPPITTEKHTILDLLTNICMLRLPLLITMLC